MRRILYRLAFIGFLLVAWQLWDSCSPSANDCPPSVVNRYIDESYERTRNSMDDFDFVTQLTTAKQYRSLAAKEQARYKAQQRQETPPCLAELQSVTVAYYYNQWHAYQSFAEYDPDLGLYYAEKAYDSIDKVIREMDRLGAEYKWDSP